MYRVRWAKRALEEVTGRWLEADAVMRGEITAAVHRADQRLQADAPWEGESRAQGWRVMFEPPLAVTFRVEGDGRTVSVTDVRVFRRKRRPGS